MKIGVLEHGKAKKEKKSAIGAVMDLVCVFSGWLFGSGRSGVLDQIKL